MSLFDVYPNGTLNIGTTNANSINIGTNAISIAFNSLLNVNNGLVIGEQKNITLAYNPTSPTEDQLGYIANGTTYSTSPVATGSVISTINIGRSGTYLFNFIINSSVLSTGHVIISGTNADQAKYGTMPTSTTTSSFSGCQIVRCTVSTYSITSNTATAVLTGSFNAVRIS